MAEKKMNIYQKLSAIQGELFVPKGNRNDFGKYNYRSCEDILKTVKPIAEKYGCVVLLTNKMLEIGGRVYVEATAKLVDLETCESIEVPAQAREEETKKGMDGSQITGAASSYARKYALAGLFCIDNEKDSDATNTHGNEPAPQPAADDDAKKRAYFIKQINDALTKKDNGKEEYARIKTDYKCDSLSDCSVSTLQKIYKEIA